MGGCKSRMTSVKIIFAFDKKYFARWTRKQWISKETSFRQVHNEVKCALTSLYSQDKYKVVLKFRGKIYNSHDQTTFLDLNAQNGEKLSISVGQKEKAKDQTLMNIRLHCCADEYICIFIKNGSTVFQLQEEIVKYKRCCNKTDLKIIYKHLELASEEYAPVIGEGILDVFSNTKLSESIQSPWKLKKSGFVKEGLCMNINCLAYKQFVSVNKGLGYFNLLDEVNHLNIEKCGICNEKLYSTHRIGFANCVYSYRAIKNDGSLQEETCKEIRAKYSEFDLIKHTEWSQLEVEVSSLPDQ